jgi:phospholipid/cholesterol/gamma-HCH transport system permease protein
MTSDIQSPLHHESDYAFPMNVLSAAISQFGLSIYLMVADFGRFTVFCTSTARWLFLHPGKWFRWGRLRQQFFAVGVASIPVVAITGAFIGMILALEG